MGPIPTLSVKARRRWRELTPNVSSGIAVDGLPGSGPYAAAKAVLHGLTRTLAKELGPVGILVNVVMPGATLTERMLARFPAAMRDQMAASSPIRRLPPPEEIVPTIVVSAAMRNWAPTVRAPRHSVLG